MSDNQAHLLSESVRTDIDVWLAKYPPTQRRSALLPALHIVQDTHNGYLTDELLDATADYLQIPRVFAYEAASFYSMYELKPVGKHKIFVCTNVSCMLNGCDTLVAHLKSKLGINLGETTADGKISLKEVECLAACGGAPAMLVNKTYHENMTPAKIDAMLEQLT
jgi:NADH-quinone oxidoreductase subunit E